MLATPIGYVIDGGGVITSGVVVGAQAILALADGDAGHGDESPEVLSRA
jgi:hypothetical protein